MGLVQDHAAKSGRARIQILTCVTWSHCHTLSSTVGGWRINGLLRCLPLLGKEVGPKDNNLLLFVEHPTSLAPVLSFVSISLMANSGARSRKCRQARGGPGCLCSSTAARCSGEPAEVHSPEVLLELFRPDAPSLEIAWRAEEKGVECFFRDSPPRVAPEPRNLPSASRGCRVGPLAGAGW